MRNGNLTILAMIIISICTFNLPDAKAGIYPEDAGLVVYGDMQLTLFGGSIQGDLYVQDNGQITMNGGSVSGNANTSNNGQVTLVGGVINEHFYALNSSQLSMSSGSIGLDLYTRDCTQAIITGGSVDRHLKALDGSQVIMTGGSVDLSLYAGYSSNDSSILSLYGTNFAIDGNSVGPGQYFASDFSSGHITGTLMEGDLLDNDFQINGDSSIVLHTPEPCTIALLGLGGYYIIRRKKI